MKNSKYIFALFAGIALFSSCKKEDIDLYSGEESIYFDQHWGLAHFTNDILQITETPMINSRQFYSYVAFGDMEATDSLLYLCVMTSGAVKDYDRSFKIEVVADSTNAIPTEEYEILEPNPMIPAGEVRTFVPFKFYKTDRMDSVNVRLQLRLVPGEHFTLPFDQDGFGRMPNVHTSGLIYKEYTTNADPAVHSVFINNYLKMPARWNDRLFGDWSEKKYRLVLNYTNELLGWTAVTWNNNAKMWDGGGYQVGLNWLGRYLREQFDKGPEYWVIDEDGTMMWCSHPSVTWPNKQDPSKLVGGGK